MKLTLQSNRSSFKTQPSVCFQTIVKVSLEMKALLQKLTVLLLE